MRERELGGQLPLPKAHDYSYEYRGLWVEGARVRIRIYDTPHGRPVVIATEPPDNPGTSMTNMIEYLAAEIVERHFRDPIDEGRHPIFIEHYPPRRYGATAQDETFDLVEFPFHEPKPVRVGGIWRTSLGDPSWKRVEKEEVERLIGQSKT